MSFVVNQEVHAMLAVDGSEVKVRLIEETNMKLYGSPVWKVEEIDGDCVGSKYELSEYEFVG